MKLKHFIIKNLNQTQSMDETLEQKLTALLPKIFPADDLKKLKMVDKMDNQIYTAQYLPFHTRDNVWLANYIAKLVHDLQVKPSRDGKKSSYRMLGVVGLADVMQFMKNSVEFTQARDCYEQNLVASYIPLLSDNTRDDFFTVAEEKRAILSHKHCSTLFRYRITEAMRFLGLPEDVIELGIEKNRSKWYARMQKHTFANLYEHVPMLEQNSQYIYSYLRKELLALEKARDEFQVNWEKLEALKYYKAHKAAIDKVGGGASYMKISKGQAVNLMKKTNATFLEYKRLLLNIIGQIKPDDEESVNRYHVNGKNAQIKLANCVAKKHVRDANLEREK